MVDKETQRTQVMEGSGSGPANRRDQVVVDGITWPVEPSEGLAPEFRYELRDRLGEGGMAFVHSALDRNLNRVVAIKQMRPEQLSSERARGRFIAEAGILATLDHPGVVPIFEAGALPTGVPFYSMKRVRGDTLEDLLAKRAPSDVRSREDIAHFVDLFERVCQTMAAAHQTRLVHRDLKPANIMIDQHGSVFVMDWGLATRKDSNPQADASKRTAAGVLLGTPAYMSPEQAKGLAELADERADVFSLGVILYEILTGTNPFDRRTIDEALDRVISFEPENPRKLNPAVGRDLAAICLKALAKDRSQRYASAVELEQDIRCYREFRPVSAIELRRIDRLVRWARRKPRLATMFATALAFVILIVVALGVQFSVESALLSDASAQMRTFEVRIQSIDARIERLSSSLEGLSPGSLEAARVARDLEDLRAVRHVEQSGLETVATAVTGFTIFSPHEGARRLLRDARRVEVEALLRDREYAAAEALLRQLLTSASRRNPLGYSAREIGWLEARLDDARRGASASGGVDVP